MQKQKQYVGFVLVVLVLTLCGTSLGRYIDVKRWTEIDPDALHPKFSNAVSDLRAKPKDPYAHMGMGLAWYDRKDYYRAIAELQKAIRLNVPTVSYGEDCHLYIGKSWWALGQKDKARAEWRTVIQMDPPNHEPGVISVGHEAEELLKWK
jgi:tetratricopeptide (TPR) repeat protein